MPQKTAPDYDALLDHLLRTQFAPDERELIRTWLAKAPSANLACWDEGHYWTARADNVTVHATKTGAMGIKQPCLRLLDGEQCGVKRTRYLDPMTGYIAAGSAYHYQDAPRHRAPRASDGWSLLNREFRAAIRLERKRRGHYGEEVA